MARQVKFKPEPRRRLRVQELARELGVPAAVLLANLRDGGEYVKSVNSFIEPPTADQLRRHYPVESTAGRDANPRAEPSGTSHGSLSAGLGPPAPPSAADNNPFKNVLKSFTAATGHKDQEAAPRHASSPAVHRSETPKRGPGDYTAARVVEPSDMMRPFSWLLWGLTEAEEDVWRGHGLGAGHAQVARECRDAGICPADLARDLNGWTVLYRLTHGEPASQIFRLLQRQDGAA